MSAGETRNFVVPNSGCNIPSTAGAYALNVTVVPQGSLGYLTVWPTGESQPYVSTLNSYDGRVKANAAIVFAGTAGGISVYVTNQTDVVLDISGYFVPSTDTSALTFFPISPCRIADTRNPNGALGGPSLIGGQARDFPVSASSCGLPASAQAYSLNFTVVPQGYLGYLSVWPTGKTQPLVSTLNADTGAVTANGAIVPAGTNGDVSVFATNNTDLVIDINGYFAPATASSEPLWLFNIAPCRVLDTRNSGSTLPPPLTVNVEGSSCGVSTSAKAFVLNATAIPDGPLFFLTLWPAGISQPLVSTLNALDGIVTSNMAIIPTSNGSIEAASDGATDLVLDINGLFASATAPTVTTGAVNSITTSTASIEGSVHQNGADTHIFFAYGTSSTLAGASDTTSLDVGSGIGTLGVSFSVPLSGLASDTKYYYQAQATNSLGTTKGAINSFTTLASATAPTVITGAASSITTSTATIAGSVNPNGADTHMVFAYGTSSTLAGASDTTSLDVGSGTLAVGISVPLNGLAAGTKYYYQVQATNSAGTTNGAINSFTTSAAPGWAGQVACVKTVTGPNYSNNETQKWTVVGGIPAQPTGQTLYPTQWSSTGSGHSASQTWVIQASGAGELAVITSQAGVSFARYNAQIAVPAGIQATPPPSYFDYEYQFSPFGNSDPNAQHVQGSSTVTSPACDSPVEPGGSSCTVTCSWNFNKN